MLLVTVKGLSGNLNPKGGSNCRKILVKKE